MKFKIRPVFVMLGILALLLVLERPPVAKTDFTVANRIAAAMVAELDAQISSNTPYVPIPTVIGVWGTSTFTSTSTGKMLAAPSTATVRQYVDQVICINAGSGLQTLAIIDGTTTGAGTNILGYANCPASGVAGSLNTFYPPLRTTAGAVIVGQMNTATGSGTQYVNVHVYQAR